MRASRGDTPRGVDEVEIIPLGISPTGRNHYQMRLQSFELCYSLIFVVVLYDLFATGPSPALWLRICPALSQQLPGHITIIRTKKC